MSQEISVCDTCVLINICAIEQPLDQLFSQIPLRFMIPKAVEAETIWVRPHPTAERHERRRVDLGPYFASGALERCDVNSERERELYVEFARSLGDGEAMALAFAASRGWLLATDDRPARRAAAAQRVQVISTPQIMRLWSENLRLSPAEIAKALAAVEILARFQPSKELPDYEWWLDIRSAEKCTG